MSSISMTSVCVGGGGWRGRLREQMGQVVQTVLIPKPKKITNFVHQVCLFDWFYFCVQKYTNSKSKHKISNNNKYNEYNVYKSN